tara:strand:- start:5638 stop:6027 length:390 start_codon:yes stop_codon:yes gene_type:complete
LRTFEKKPKKDSRFLPFANGFNTYYSGLFFFKLSLLIIYHRIMTNQDYTERELELAQLILQPYRKVFEYTAPERTIHQLREDFLKSSEEATITEFTAGMRVLLERRYIQRLNDERLELTPAGREWMTQE